MFLAADIRLPNLFDGSFSYPANSLLGKCIPRLKIKNSPSETRNARIFIKGSGSSYTLGLSSQDEFREYSFYGDGGSGNLVRQIDEESQGVVTTFGGSRAGVLPLLRLDVSAGPDTKAALLIGRATDVVVELFDRDKFMADKGLKLTDTSNDLVKEILANPAPKLKLKFSTDRANRIDMSYELENASSLTSDLFEHLRQINLDFSAFDFAIEGTSNPISGSRSARNHFPGPNDASVANRLVLSTKIENSGPKKDGPLFVKRIELQDAQGQAISKWLTSRVTDGWAPMKAGETTPPYNTTSDGGKTIREYVIPNLGISIESSKELDSLCDFDASAVIAPEWDISFTENTKFSWMYNVTAPGISITDPSNVKPVDEYVFSASSMTPGHYQGVPTFSMAKRCVVPSSISLVFGMYVCDQLIVQDRKAPLTFIGTLIVRNIQLSSSSVRAGINFYSIWNARAIDILKQRGDLVRKNKPVGDNACVFDEPGWRVGIDEATAEDFQNCSPMKFVYYGANNFNWTTVDPEIGLPPSGAHNQTMSKVPNRYRRYSATIVWVK